MNFWNLGPNWFAEYLTHKEETDIQTQTQATLWSHQMSKCVTTQSACVARFKLGNRGKYSTHLLSKPHKSDDFHAFSANLSSRASKLIKLASDIKQNIIQLLLERHLGLKSKFWFRFRLIISLLVSLWGSFLSGQNRARQQRRVPKTNFTLIEVRICERLRLLEVETLRFG